MTGNWKEGTETTGEEGEKQTHKEKKTEWQTKTKKERERMTKEA